MLVRNVIRVDSEGTAGFWGIGGINEPRSGELVTIRTVIQCGGGDAMNVSDLVLQLSRIIERNEARIAAGDRVVMENLRSRELLPEELWVRIEPELKGFVHDMCSLLRRTLRLRKTRDKLRSRLRNSD